ncbi:MAG: hypothetical protein GMKNLPBB_00608 [Myxococcota bacterium]|nr:hypothetical protein [Myxococcota bacterium]
MKPETRNRLIKAIGYPLFFLIALLLFIDWTFPSSLLKHRVVEALENATGGKVEILKFKAGLFGASMENISVLIPSSKPGGKSIPLMIDNLDLSPKFGALFRGAAGAAVHARLAGGEMDGAAEVSRSGTEIKTDIRQIDLSRLPIIAAKTGIPFTGKIGGNLAFRAAPEAAKNSGVLVLKGEGLVMGPGAIEARELEALGGKFNVPQTTLGALEGDVEIQGEKALVKEFRTSGGDASLSVDGSLNLNYKNFGQSAANLNLRLNIEQAYLSKNATMSGLMMLLRSNPMTQKYSPGPTQIAVGMSGLLNRPAWLPATAAAPKPPGK